MAERHVIERPAPAPEKESAPQPAPAPPQTARPSRKRRLVPVLVLAALVAAGFAIWRLFLAAPPIPDSIVAVSGRIEGDDSAVSPKTSGRVLEVRFREGDSVNAGDVIAVLDFEQLHAREEMAKAGLNEAEAKTKAAREQISVLQEQLRTEEANVSQQEAAADLAQFDKDAYTRLAKSGAVSERQGKQAASTAEQQAAAVVAAKRRVATVRMQLSQQQADIASTMASLSQSRAQLREAQVNRQDLIVKAPFSGTVATRTAEPGEVVNAGTPIVTLVDLSKVYLRGFVPEGQIGKVKVGQPVRIYLDSNPKQPIDAFVARIDPQATFTPENTYFRDDRVKQVVGVKLQLKGGYGYAKPGMPADGEILVSGDSWPEGKWRK